MKKMILSKLSMCLLLALPSFGFANEGSDLPILVQKVIRVVKWDKRTQTYEIISKEFPGEGASNATPKGMTMGIASLRLEELEKDPNRIVGEEFETTAELPTLFPDELEERAAKAPKSRK